MKIGARKGSTALLWFVAILVLAGLACAQAGEVLTPEEATERARQPITGTNGSGDLGGEFQVGDRAELTGRSFLVNILDGPAGRIISGQQRGAEVTVQQVAEAEGELWYMIEAPAGTGWVRADNLVPLEGEAPQEGQTEGEGAEASGGIQPGDTVYLQGTNFLVNLLDQPGGRIVAGQNRGEAVVVVEVTQQDGKTWYLVDAPGGEGWVLEENVTTETP